MNLRQTLENRIRLRDIRLLCSEAAARPDVAEQLYALTLDPDARVAYNALWVLTHLPAADCRALLHPRRDRLIDCALGETHVGKLRLLLTLLDKLPPERNELRGDYLDFCLERINSTEPYAIRAFCLKQAYAQCRHYPELLAELRVAIDLMERSELPPGLRCARRNLLRRLSRGAI
ncbi:MAG: hypothetical protein K2N10_01145 [Muribaculaceae bacterium]|nr:hypothetical protein [Muribaculaceae bacterium]